MPTRTAQSNHRSPASQPDTQPRKQHGKPEKTPPAAPPPIRKALIQGTILALILIAVTAAGVGLYAWTQWNRPGATHSRAGQALINHGKAVEAEREWKAGIQSDPSFPDCYQQLGELYVALHRFDDAAGVFTQATKVSPTDGLLFLRLAQIQQFMQDPKAAQATARQAIRLLPGNPDAVGLYGMLSAKLKQGPQALAALTYAHAKRPDNPDYLTALVYADMDQSRLRDAEMVLTPYLSAHPGDTQAEFQMAVIQSLKPRTPETLKAALEYAQDAEPGMTGDMRLYSLLGTLYLDNHQPAQALAVFQRGQRVSPQSEVVLHGLTDCAIAMGDKAAAARYGEQLRMAAARHDQIEHLKHVMGFNHDDTTSGLKLAHLEEEDGDLKQALIYFTQLVRQAPKDPRTRPALAGFFRRYGQPALAKRVLTSDEIPPLPDVQ